MKVPYLIIVLMFSAVSVIAQDFKLKYRLPYGNHEIPITDGLQAMRHVRAKAEQWGINPQNSINFYSALKKYNVPAEMHIFQKGGHGFGMKKTNLPVDKWPDMFADWLKTMDIIK